MAFDAANRLIRLGMATQLASEIARQIGTGAGDPLRLISLGVPYPLADEIAKQINAGTGQAQRLMALGVAYPLAIEMAEQIQPAGPRLSVALSGQMTPGSTVTLTATITGAETPVTSLASVSLTVGGSAVTLSGTGLVRTGRIPAGAMAGASIVAAATAVADGNTISGGATSTVVAIPVAPPVAAGGISDQSWTVGAAVSLDVAADFTGTGITYALAPSSSALPAGLSLSSAGVISGTPTAEATGTIVVRGTNVGGYADTAFGFAVTAGAEFGALSIAADGWRADWRLDSTNAEATWAQRHQFNPSSDAEALTVSRNGFDTAGQPVVYNDKIRPLSEVRKAWNVAWSGQRNTWPLDRVADGASVRSPVSLSEFIYQGETVMGVANNSVRPYPKCVFMWLHSDYTATSGVFVARAFVDHLFARAGRPVAAVRFIATWAGGSQEVMATVGKVTYDASGKSVPCFEASFDFSALPNDTPITLNAIVYPWRGPAQDLSVMGNPAPHMWRTTLTVYKRASYSYAYVSPTGSDSTGVASATVATAEASPFATIDAAATALNTLLGSLSGGVVRLAAGVSLAPTVTTGNRTTAGVPFIIENAPGVSADAAIMTDRQATLGGNNIPTRTVIQGITLRRASATLGSILRHDTAVGSSLSIKDCILDANNIALLNYWLRNTGRCWFINNEDINGITGASAAYTTNVKRMVAIGCKNVLPTGAAGLGAILGCTGVNVIGSPIDGALSGFILDGAAWAFNHVTGPSNTAFAMTLSGAHFTAEDASFSIAGNIIEQIGTSGSGDAYADADNTEVHGLIYRMNTLPATGENGRLNWLYNDITTATALKDGSRQWNIYSRSACKTDYFISTATAVGNWPAVFHVDSIGNLAADGTTPANAGLGPGSWRRETEYPLAQWGDANAARIPNYVLNKAIGSADPTGGGDYRILSGDYVQKIPAGMAPYAWDQLGRAVPDDGTGYVGALPLAA